MNIKKTILIFLFTVLTICTISTFGTTISNLQNEQNEISNEIKGIQQSLANVEGEIAKVEKELVNLDVQLNVAEEEYNNIREQLNNAELDLLQAEAELVEAVDTKNTQYETLKNRLAYMYEYGNTSYVEIILGSNSIYDMFNRAEYVTTIAEYDRNLLTEYEKQEKIVENKVKEVEVRKAEIQKLYVEAEIKKENLEKTYADKMLIMTKMEADKTEHANMIESLKKENANIEAKIKEEQRKAEELLKQQQQQGNDMIYGGGQMGWPVEGYHYVTSEYSDRINPVTGRPEFHKGIDLRAPTGTNILAAESGVVIDARYSSSYGYLVTISHGNGISTLYAHNSKLLVSNGDIVTRGSVIAKAGSTGQSTAPHCHFEVRIDGKAVNPRSYIIQ